VPIDVAFAVSQTTGEIRCRWDPFVDEQQLLDGAVVPAKGVRTLTKSRHKLKMVSRYISFRPPTQVGMRMVEGPWFFANFAGGWSFARSKLAPRQPGDTPSRFDRSCSRPSLIASAGGCWAKTSIGAPPAMRKAAMTR